MALASDPQPSVTLHYKCSLLGLPPELRLNIYDYLVSADLVKSEQHIRHFVGLSGVFIHGADRKIYRDILALAKVCHEVKDEVDDFMHRLKVALIPRALDSRYLVSRGTIEQCSLLRDSCHVRIHLFSSRFSDRPQQTILELIKPVTAWMLKNKSLKTIDFDCVVKDEYEHYPGDECVKTLTQAYLNALPVLEERGVRVSLFDPRPGQSLGYPIMKKLFQEAGWMGSSFTLTRDGARIEF